MSINGMAVIASAQYAALGLTPLRLYGVTIKTITQSSLFNAPSPFAT